MTHEERIAKSDFLIAQMKELIKETNEKLKRMDDENMCLLPKKIIPR